MSAVWIAWPDRKCPVPRRTVGRVRFSDGVESPVKELEFWDWENQQGDTDIVAYTVEGMLPEDKTDRLRKELAAVLNKNSRENVSNTPDFLLAEFLILCMSSWDMTHNKLRVWQAQHFDETVEMPMPVVEWRPLLDGEFVEEGDEEYSPVDVWPHRKEWHPVRSRGYFYDSKLHVPHRRRDELLIYVDLQNGDLIWEDDEFFDIAESCWVKTDCYGQVYGYGPHYSNCGHRPHRRLFAEGYHWLRAGDVVINGDEILENGVWSAINEKGVYDPVTMKPVRRKI